MKKVRCRDVGFDCDHTIEAQTEAEIMARVAEHAREVHGLTDITPEILTTVKNAIHEA